MRTVWLMAVARVVRTPWVSAPPARSVKAWSAEHVWWWMQAWDHARLADTLWAARVAGPEFFLLCRCGALASPDFKPVAGVSTTTALDVAACSGGRYLRDRDFFLPPGLWVGEGSA